MVNDPELSCIGSELIAAGFTCQNHLGAKFIFRLDDIAIYWDGHMWVIEDIVNGRAGFFTLKELIESEFWRWEEE